MKLVNAQLGLEMDLIENRVNVLVVEHPVVLSEIIETLMAQANGLDGSFVLSKDFKPLSINKSLDMVWHPHALDFNNRMIQTKLFQMLKSQSEENLVDETAALNQRILAYFDLVLSQMPLALGYEVDFDFQGLLKLYHVGVSTEDMPSITERIIEYIRINAFLLNQTTLLFYNLKSILDEKQLEEVYEFAFYSKINVILLESCERNRLDSEAITVIDSDRCIFSYT